MPASFARHFRSAMRCAIGTALAASSSAPSNSRSLMTSIMSNATGEVSGTLPCRSRFLAGIVRHMVSKRCAGRSSLVRDGRRGIGTIRRKHYGSLRAKTAPDPAVEEPPERQRQAGPDEHDAAGAADAGNHLTGNPRQLAGVREAEPAARLLAEAAGLVRLPLPDIT